MRNGRWSDEASQAVYDEALFNVAETCIDKEAVVISDLEENIIFQCIYKKTTGCKISTVHGHGYMSTRPTERESMKAQLEEQARATDAANQKNIELQEETEKLNDKLKNQEAESERKLEEKLKQFKEEESRKIQALRDEFMSALQGNRQTPLAPAAPNSLDIQGKATPPPVDKSAVNIPDSNANETTSVQSTLKIADIPGSDRPPVCKIPANIPIVGTVASKTPSSKAKRSLSQTNKQFISPHNLMNARVKRIRTRSQQL
ncbi:hypothetical protein PVAP13_3KG475500 [Panicum virgatum]|uniref:Uncharacterized protein n=1 Tax=Panicum virgatum TaxID=38727 RepID=A0A8T0V711_PANVG|nr:hypothetical protein PVAP13_3KG475500 [Panicum virgatum]